jgi:hypothetical protein
VECNSDQGDVAQAVARLKQQPGQNILMYGCSELARTLMQHDPAQ